MKTKYFFLLTLLISSCSPKQSVEEYFSKTTGLNVTEPINLLVESDNYIGAEGEYSMIFITNDKQINNWISNQPPWSLKEWKKGIVDPNIGLHCSFGDSQGSPSVITINGKTNYRGNEKVIEILTDSNNLYSFQERCCPEQGDNLRFHNGTLLIINPRTNTVYLSIWDF